MLSQLGLCLLGLCLLEVLSLAEGATWKEQKVVPSDGSAGDHFGNSLYLSASGDVLFVGAAAANGTGVAYVFEMESSANWTQTGRLQPDGLPSGAQFGSTLACDTTGKTVLIAANKDDGGGTNSGSAFVFTRTGANDSWQQESQLTASDAAADDYFGTSVALNGSMAVIGTSRKDSSTGAVYLFLQAADGNWTQAQKWVASDANTGDFFGVDSAINRWGAEVLVGAYLDDEQGTNAGAAYIFTNDATGEDATGNWTQAQKITTSDAQDYDDFGVSVSLDGDWAVVGATLEDDGGSKAGAAYVFYKTPNGTWVEFQKLTSTDAAAGDNFGRGVSVHDDRIFVSSPKDDASGSDSGSAYMFEWANGSWVQSAKLTASDGAAGDLFGWVAAHVRGHVAAVGAYLHDAAGSDSGAAYIYTLLDDNDTSIAPTPAPTSKYTPMPTHERDDRDENDKSCCQSCSVFTALAATVHLAAMGTGFVRLFG